MLRIDGDEVLVDLGSADGVHPGDEVRLYRRISVEHPVTHRVIEDRFPLGDEQLEQVAERMAIIVVDTPLDHPPTVGDTVVLLRSTPALETPAPPDSCPVCPSCPVQPVCEMDPQARALLDAFGRTLGQPIEQRIGVWEAYLAANPATPWSSVVSADVESLRAMLRTLRGGAPALTPGTRPRAGHDPPLEACTGDAVELVVAIDAPDMIRLVQMHVRHEDERGYREFDLTRDGDFYFRGTIPAEFVREDGFQYFLVAVTTAGAEVPLGGTPERPIAVPVEERFEAPPVRSDRSNLHTSFEYVDFYVNSFARDYYLKFEADFRYVVGSWFYALRMGFGIFDGSGGPVETTDWTGNDESLPDPEPISYRYGFTELEFRFHELFYLIGRISFGSASAYELGGRAPEALVGGGGRIRIGRPNGTNLELGGGYTEALGYEANVSVNLGLVEDVPLRAHIIVTDMPLNDDLGVRLVAEAGWRPTPWFEFAGLAGYDIRDINHTGLSLGLGLTFLW
ncbi:MAG: hypothetical protein HY907_05605 [Deltaproteobacteria bacterium]|nr:hypothetical protein [Deltaproteobacteria bacterium]